MFKSGKGFSMMAVFVMMLLGFPSLVQSQEDKKEVALVEFVGNATYNPSGAWIERPDKYIAQRFTTGPNKGGYELYSVDMYFRDWRIALPNSGGIEASLYSFDETTELPGEELVDFVSPENLHMIQDDWKSIPAPASRFTIPGEYTLSPSTKYFVLVTGTNYEVNFTRSPNEDDTKADGWEIDDVHILHQDFTSILPYLPPGHPALVTSVESNSLKMKLSGKAYDDGTLRVADTDDSDSIGNLEIFDDADGDNIGSWKLICDDGWGGDESEVACRQLGLSGGTKRPTPSAAEFADRYTSEQLRELIASASDAFLLDDVDCQGDESRVIDCDHDDRGVHDCAVWEAVGVTCEDIEE